ncbi:HlyD family secretion protein [Croceimicrobium sp.]|uniref:HlyD family secretion protein n=1 Tax=Croceimicrobium sp. TaxID=2828340 RepID=UPI003BAAA206
MLNISPENDVAKKIDRRRYSSMRVFLDEARLQKSRKRLYLIFFSIMVGALFLPWTQNIRSKGYVTSLQPEKRPQTLQSVIGGRIEQWYVREGDFVRKGDTLLYISETKNDYFDPRLLERTDAQIQSKRSSQDNYQQKAASLETQVNALKENRRLKLQQARNKIEISRLKVIADSIDLVAAKTNESIAEAQMQRMDTLYSQGLYSKTDLEKRRQKLQETTAKRVAQESKLLATRNELINAQVELNAVSADYDAKISKAESERYATLSSMYGTEAEVSKLENQYSNYAVRTSNYYLRAPQDGYITKALKTGLGETVKEGEQIVTIMPADYDLAIEMYVRPIDYPLMHVGEEVRIQFDGWPAIFFSGWPGVSVGTFAGRIVAIDNFTSQNGMYRLLVAPDPEGVDWPEGIRPGAGAKTFALLNDVPIWYEIWRQINGFPADFYTPENKAENPESKSSAKK